MFYKVFDYDANEFYVDDDFKTIEEAEEFAAEETQRDPNLNLQICEYDDNLNFMGDWNYE